MKLLKLPILLMTLIFSVACLAEGNPRPGFPHDTLIFHVKKAASGVVTCGGGHASFIRYDEAAGEIVPVDIFITMVDWNQIDNDGDGLFDEDPAGDANGDTFDDDDFDGLIDEDGVEPGAVTAFTDCDGLDGDITLVMRDTDPRAGWISTQEWFIRGIGKPEQNFAFWTNADQVTCVIVDDPDGFPNTGDEVIDCSYSSDDSDWIPLGYVSTNGTDENGIPGGEICVKQVSLKGKNSKKGGGKTAFCDITDEFMVDVDVDGDGVFNVDAGDLANQFIFSVSCFDLTGDGATIDPVECELSRMIWDVDENNTTSKAKAQVFVGHTGEAMIKKGKIHGKHK